MKMSVKSYMYIYKVNYKIEETKESWKHHQENQAKEYQWCYTTAGHEEEGTSDAQWKDWAEERRMEQASCLIPEVKNNCIIIYNYLSGSKEQAKEPKHYSWWWWWTILLLNSEIMPVKLLSTKDSDL